MKMLKFVSKSPQKTIEFGKHLATRLQKGDVIALFGDLGSGKTTLVKGIAKGLKVKPSKVHSPTFTLMNCYEGKVPVYHFDLYRLDDIKEIDRLGCEEFFYDNGVSIIEWAEKLDRLLPAEYLEIKLKHKNVNERSLTLKAFGTRYTHLLKRLK